MIKNGKIQNNVELDEFVVMPNYIHGIIQIAEMHNDVGAHCDVTLQTEQSGKSTHNSIPTIIKLYKSPTTKQINQFRNKSGLPVW